MGKYLHPRNLTNPHGRPLPSQNGRFSGAMTEDLLTLISGWVHKTSVASSRVVGLITPSHMAIHINPDSTNMRYFYMCKTSVSKCFPQYLRFSTLTAGGKRDICRDVQQIRRHLVMQEGLSVWLQTISNLRDCCESRECLFEIVQKSNLCTLRFRSTKGSLCIRS